MPSIVTLTGTRHTDGSRGIVSLIPRIPWSVDDGTTITASGPLSFVLQTDGSLLATDNTPATVVATYDSNNTLVLNPEGCSYIVRINVAGQEVTETWTIDGANASIDWATLGIKPTPADRITYPAPVTVDSNVRRYEVVGDIPAGMAPGVIVYVKTGQAGWYGVNSFGQPYLLIPTA